jgi:protein tyrosine phosphatase
MIATLNILDEALSKGHNVYLHCWGGIGRTGTTVGCYLVRHGKTGQQALDQIAEWWQDVPKRVFYPRSPQTDAQVQFILDWKE